MNRVDYRWDYTSGVFNGGGAPTQIGGAAMKIGGAAMKIGSAQKIIIDRANTSFYLKLLEYYRANKWNSKWDFLKYYQNIARLYMTDVNSGARGLLAYVMMGLGKSILAVAIAVDLMETHQPIMIMTKSIQKNMRAAIKKYVVLRAAADNEWPIGRLPESDLDAWIERKFSFVSMNASNMMAQVGRAAESESTRDFENALDEKFGEVAKNISLEGKVIIIDEAHNFFRAITNGSKNARGLYDKIMATKNIKLLFLTGTPIANDPFELVPCFNMLGGGPGRPVVLPDSYKEFNELYVGTDNKIKNREKFQNRITGLVSYVDHGSKQGSGLGHVETGRVAEFPQDLATHVVKCHMSHAQYSLYRQARDKEMEESKFGPGGTAQPTALTIPKGNSSSTYRVKSRQLSNFAPPSGISLDNLTPDAASSSKFDAIWQNFTRGQLNLVYSQFVGLGGLGSFMKFLEGKGCERVEIGRAVNLTEDVVENTVVEGGSLMGEFGSGPHDSIELPIIGAAEFAESYIQGIENAFRAHDAYQTVYDGNPSYPPGRIGAHDLTSLDIGEVEMADASAAITLNPLVFSNPMYTRKPYYVLSDGHNWQIIKVAGDKLSIELENLTSNHEAFARKLAEDRVAAAQGQLAPWPIGGGAESAPIRFAIIAGDIDIDTRELIQNEFNRVENKHGGIIDILLISSTGAEGLDLKNIRRIHIMEPYWNYGRINQVKFRGVRNDSHVALPPEERNVTTFIYLAVPPAEETSREQMYTTDIELYEKSVRNESVVVSFNEALRGVSIECLINAESWCRVCAPTDEKLYSAYPEQDIVKMDPCRKLVEKSVVAQEIEHDGRKYFYAPDESSNFGWKIYFHNPDTNTHMPLRESDKKFVEILEKIDANVFD